MQDTCTLSLGDVSLTLLKTGASIRSLRAPDKTGNVEDIVLGHPTNEEYSTDPQNAYFGCVVGRVANRIENGTFIIPPHSGKSEETKLHTLERNDAGKHALHGGSKHWGRQPWTLDSSTEKQSNKKKSDQESPDVESCKAVFKRTSPAGEAGYPGQVDATVTYELYQKDGNTTSLRITMEATASETTPVNVVQHTHWNLAGQAAVAKGTSVAGHSLSLNAAHYTPVSAELIPIGLILPTCNTLLDFQHPAPLAAALEGVEGGLDHNYVLSAFHSSSGQEHMCPGGMLPGEPQWVATLTEPCSRRKLVLYSNAPGVQVYSGNFLDGVPGKDGVVHLRHQSVCLETQTFPNSVNEAGNFPSPLVQPGQTYVHVMVFEIGIV